MTAMEDPMTASLVRTRRWHRPAGGASRLLATVALWLARSRQRRQLGQLDDRLLRDIGVDRASAIEEASKPFWCT